MSAEKNIFIIDDDEIFTFLTKKMITSTDSLIQVKTFGDGDEAINYLKSISGNKEMLPDMILLDLNMPVLDGWGFLEEFETLHFSLKKEIAIYISSSSISPFEIEKARNNKLVADFIVKPYDAEKINEIVKHALN